MKLVEWLTQHGPDVLAVIGAAVSLATVIVKLTPSQKDDAVLSKVVSVLEKLSLVNPNGTETVKK